MKEIIDLEKLYDILTNKLTWVTEYGEEVYLLARENIRNSIQDAKKRFVYSCIIKKLLLFLLSLRFSLLTPLQRMLRQLPVLWQQETGARKASAE